MYEMSVRTSRGAYDILVGGDILSERSREHSLLIVDSVIAGQFVLSGSVMEVEATEPTKTLSGVEEIVIGMHSHGIRRDSSVMAVGGGVVQDIVTLAASIYMRGIPWAYAPTTMMSMLDSCIGGKSSINVSGVKNLVGNIYPPSQVVVDVAMAQTLSMEARISGYAEASKICFAAGPEAFREYLALIVPPGDFGGDRYFSESAKITHHVLATKKWFVEVDEFDRRERLLLNFGHTFGHALESAVGFSIPHGVAVAIGMSAAVEFCGHRASLVQDLRTYIDSMASALPVEFLDRLNAPDWDVFARVIQSDKKGSRSEMRFVLPDEAGRLALVSLDRNDRNLRSAVGATEAALTRFAGFVGSGS